MKLSYGDSPDGRKRESLARNGKAHDISAGAAIGFRRRAVSWLGLLLLAFNLVAGGAQPSAKAAFPPSDHITICTVAGMVALDQDGRTQQPSPHESVCGFCLPLMHAGAMAPMADWIGYRRIASDAGEAESADQRRPVPGQGFSPHSARAPPPPL